MRGVHIAILAACVAPWCFACDPSATPCMPDAHPSDGSDQSDVVADAALGDAPPDADAASAAGEAGSQGLDAANPEVSAMPLSWLRVANWSPDAPPVDFCIAPHGTTDFRGPVVQTLASSREAGSAALGFPVVSAYFSLPPGQYDARVVVSMAGGCGVAIAPDKKSLPAFAANSFQTVALLGEELPSGGDPGLQIAGFTDTTAPGSGVSLRFINASPMLSAADFGKGSLAGKGGSFKALFTGVFFATSSTPKEAPQTSDASPTVDGNGYLLNQSLSATTLSAHDPTAGTDAVRSQVSIAGGSVITLVLVGGTSAGVTPKLLQCVDNSGTVGALENCMLLP